MAYDAISINCRGPGGIGNLNFPGEIPDAVFEQLGVTRADRSDSNNRFLLAMQLRDEGREVSDFVAASGDGTVSSAAAPAAGGVEGASARLAAWFFEGAASEVPSASGSSGPFPGYASDAEERAALSSSLKAARARIASAGSAGANPLLGIFVKVGNSS